MSEKLPLRNLQGPIKISGTNAPNNGFSELSKKILKGSLGTMDVVFPSYEHTCTLYINSSPPALRDPHENNFSCVELSLNRFSICRCSVLNVYLFYGEYKKTLPNVKRNGKGLGRAE